MTAYKLFRAELVAQDRKPPTPNPSKHLLGMTTGVESDWLRADAQNRWKKRRRIVSGEVEVTVGKPRAGATRTTLTFEACLDYRKIKTAQDGKPIRVTPWLRNLVEMRKRSGKWLVSDERGWDGKVDASCPKDIS